MPPDTMDFEDRSIYMRPNGVSLVGPWEESGHC